MEYNLFDHISYKNEYDDLTFLETKDALWRHWCLFGKKEGRNCFFFKPIPKMSKEFFEENYTIYITRHINSEITKRYWKINNEYIRKYYKKIKIIIIDDNSEEKYKNEDKDYKDIEFIYTTFVGCGELLPYYYFLNNKTKYAIFIHDSVFVLDELHKYIEECEYLSLWNFNPLTEINVIKNRTNELIELSSKINKEHFLKKFNSMNWKGVFGGMCMISHEYLKKINDTIEIEELLNEIKSRFNRMCLERLLGSIIEESNKSLLGEIALWCKFHTNSFWDLSLKEFEDNKNVFEKECILLKIWTGR
jgi:hypothetical protein